MVARLAPTIALRGLRPTRAATNSDLPIPVQLPYESLVGEVRTALIAVRVTLVLIIAHCRDPTWAWWRMPSLLADITPRDGVTFGGPLLLLANVGYRRQCARTARVRG
jgi:hypothetical protein